MNICESEVTVTLSTSSSPFIGNSFGKECQKRLLPTGFSNNNSPFVYVVLPVRPYTNGVFSQMSAIRSFGYKMSRLRKPAYVSQSATPAYSRSSTLQSVVCFINTYPSVHHLQQSVQATVSKPFQHNRPSGI